MVRRTRLRATVVAAAALALLAGGAPASAQGKPDHGTSTPRFKQVNRVSDQDLGGRVLMDADAVNSWGLALGPTSPLWVSNNGTGTATIYSGGVHGKRLTKSPLTVDVGDAPTGAVFNDTTDFVVPGTGLPAMFIFVSETGDITAWNRNAGDTAVVVKPAEPGEDHAIYKGVSILHTPSGPLLLATDFHNGRIDVFDGQFRLQTTPVFSDTIPGFAPFNVLAVGDKVYVTYAMQDAAREDDVAGLGLGFVDLFTNIGQTVRRIASRGTLNAPWGLAIAPEGFGQFTGDLLVGNFGDGRINVFDGVDFDFQGQLQEKGNKTIIIDGLWALLPGTATTGGTGTLWFSAGPDDESHGLVGQLIPTSQKNR